MPLKLGPDLRVLIVDATGAAASIGGGTQYADGATQANPTGNVVLWLDTANAIRAASAAKPLPVNVISGGGGSQTDASAWTTAVTSFAPGGGVFNDSAAALTSGQQGTLRVTAQRGQHVNLRNNTGAEIGVAALPLLMAGPVAGGAAESFNSVSIGFVGTGGTHRNATAAPSVNSTTGTDIIGVGNLVKGTTNFFSQQGDDSGNTKIVGTIAHDGVDSGNPTKGGFRAIAHGTNPTAVSAADRSDWLGNVAGVPFVIGGHPNVQTFAQNYTSAQTNTKIITVAAGTKIVVTGFLVAAANSNTVDTTVRLGFATTTTPTYGSAQLIGTHPGVPPGSGFGRGTGAGMLGVGADDEDLIFNCSVPTGGSLDVMVSYYTIAT